MASDLRRSRRTGLQPASRESSLPRSLVASAPCSKRRMHAFLGLTVSQGAELCLLRRLRRRRCRDTSVNRIVEIVELRRPAVAILR